MQFECREIVYCIITYNKEQYSEIDPSLLIKSWQEELTSNSLARPVYLGSILDDDDGHMNLDTSNEEDADPDTVYVILYYYYEDSTYLISDDIDLDWVINFDPVLASLGLECAMDSIATEENTEYFECDSSSGRTETMIAIYAGSEMIVEGPVAEICLSSKKSNN